MHLFVSENGFWIQDTVFAVFLMGKEEVWAYNPFAPGQINDRLPTNPEQNMVGKRKEFNTFQFNSTKSDSAIPVFFSFYLKILHIYF